MISLRARLSALVSRTLVQPKLDPQLPPETQRRAAELAGKLLFLPRGVQRDSRQLGGRPVEVFTPERSDPGRAILHFHGGGYVIGSPGAFRSYAGHLAKAAGCPVYSVAYRLAPEHPFPAAVDDAVSAYQELAGHLPPSKIALAGDSAGGGLCLSALLRLRETGQPLPSCALLICPLTDLTLSGASIQRNRHLEPMIRKDWLDMCAEYYAAETPRDDPALSPIFADLSGLPPLLIQAAGNDILLDDARRIQALARDAGVDSKLEVFADLGHVFQMAPGMVPEARRAVAMAGAYIKIRQ